MNFSNFYFKRKLGFISFIALASLSYSSAVFGMDTPIDENEAETKKMYIRVLKQQAQATYPNRTFTPQEYSYTFELDALPPAQSKERFATFSALEQENVTTLLNLCRTIEVDIATNMTSMPVSSKKTNVTSVTAPTKKLDQRTAERQERLQKQLAQKKGIQSLETPKAVPSSAAKALEQEKTRLINGLADKIILCNELKEAKRLHDLGDRVGERKIFEQLKKKSGGYAKNIRAAANFGTAVIYQEETNYSAAREDAMAAYNLNPSFREALILFTLADSNCPNHIPTKAFCEKVINSKNSPPEHKTIAQQHLEKIQNPEIKNEVPPIQKPSSFEMPPIETQTNAPLLSEGENQEIVKTPSREKPVLSLEPQSQTQRMLPSEGVPQADTKTEETHKTPVSDSSGLIVETSPFLQALTHDWADEEDEDLQWEMLLQYQASQLKTQEKKDTKS